MVDSLRFWLLALTAVAACDTLAAGPSYGVTPGAREISGKISEWSVPTAKFPHDPAVTPDGNICFAVKKGDRIARFDRKSQHFKEWEVPAGTLPNGVVVAADGKVIFGGFGNGTINELDPSTGKLREYKTPSRDSAPYALTLDTQGDVWFTERKSSYVGKLERSSGKITEYRVGDGPYGVAVDKQGNAWVSRKSADMFAKLDPNTGTVTELYMGLGSQPRRIAVTPDGMVWVALYGTGKLAKIDPVANKVVEQYELPGGPNGGPYAVNADGRGRVWVSEIQTNSVILFDPRTEAMRVFDLPSSNSGVRNAAIDADGRYWYIGSYSGKLGVIE